MMYFQLEVNYYSHKVNKNKYKNFELKASTKNNFTIPEEHQIVQDIVSATTTCHTLLLELQGTLLLGLVVA